MKIEAAFRLNALRIIPQEDAYSEKAGRYNLKNYGDHRSVKVGTNIPGIEIAVSRNPDEDFFQEVFLIHENVAVGTVAITKGRLNDMRGMIYEPSSYFDPKYRGLGYAKALYRWILNSGTNLATKKVQSKFSNALWHSLAKEFTMLEVLGNTITENKEYEAKTRLVLLGKGNTKDMLIKEFKLADNTVWG